MNPSRPTLSTDGEEEEKISVVERSANHYYCEIKRKIWKQSVTEQKRGDKVVINIVVTPPHPLPSRSGT